MSTLVLTSYLMWLYWVFLLVYFARFGMLNFDWIANDCLARLSSFWWMNHSAEPGTAGRTAPNALTVVIGGQIVGNFIRFFERNWNIFFCRCDTTAGA